MADSFIITADEDTTPGHSKDIDCISSPLYSLLDSRENTLPSYIVAKLCGVLLLQEVNSLTCDLLLNSHVTI